MKTASEWCKLFTEARRDENFVAAIQADARAGLLALLRRVHAEACDEDSDGYELSGSLVNEIGGLLHRLANPNEQSVAGSDAGAGAAKEAAGPNVDRVHGSASTDPYEPVGGGETSRLSFTAWHRGDNCPGNWPANKQRCDGNVSWMGGRTCRERFAIEATKSNPVNDSATDSEQEKAAAAQPAQAASESAEVAPPSPGPSACKPGSTYGPRSAAAPVPAPGPGQPPPLVFRCQAGAHSIIVAGPLIDGACVSCWRDRARIMEGQRDAAQDRARDLLAACEQKQEIVEGAVRTNQELVAMRERAERAERKLASLAAGWSRAGSPADFSEDGIYHALTLSARNIDELVARAEKAEAELALAREANRRLGEAYPHLEAAKDALLFREQRDAARAELARAREAMPSGRDLRSVASHLRDRGSLATADMVDTWASRIEALGEQAKPGRDLREGFNDVANGRDGGPVPAPDRAAVEEALREARDAVGALHVDGDEGGDAVNAALDSMLRAVEALAGRAK